MPSPILARADALMQRRRQGETGPLDDLPVLTDTVDADDTLPVLSETLCTQAYGLTLDSMAEMLAARIRERLASELPALIEATVRDFLAEQGEITESSEDD